MVVAALTTFAMVMIPLGLIVSTVLVLAIIGEGIKQDVDGLVGRDDPEKTRTPH